MKHALITGITGQDGSYLTELLLAKDYQVHGIVRRSSNTLRTRIDHLTADSTIYGQRLFLHYADLDDATTIRRLLLKIVGAPVSRRALPMMATQVPPWSHLTLYRPSWADGVLFSSTLSWRFPCHSKIVQK